MNLKGLLAGIVGIVSLVGCSAEGFTGVTGTMKTASAPVATAPKNVTSELPSPGTITWAKDIYDYSNRKNPNAMPLKFTINGVCPWNIEGETLFDISGLPDIKEDSYERVELVVSWGTLDSVEMKKVMSRIDVSLIKRFMSMKPTDKDYSLYKSFVEQRLVVHPFLRETAISAMWDGRPAITMMARLEYSKEVGDEIRTKVTDWVGLGAYIQVAK